MRRSYTQPQVRIFSEVYEVRKGNSDDIRVSYCDNETRATSLVKRIIQNVQTKFAQGLITDCDSNS